MIAAVAAGAVAVTAFVVLRPVAPEPEADRLHATAAPGPRPAARPTRPPLRSRRAVRGETGGRGRTVRRAAAPAAKPHRPSDAAHRGDVPGAQVFIDRQFIGAAPVVAENVAPGTHQLNVSAEGFESYAATIDVSPGERDIVIKFREVRLDVVAGRDPSARHRLMPRPAGRHAAGAALRDDRTATTRSPRRWLTWRRSRSTTWRRT